MEYQEKFERLKMYRMLDAKIANLTEELQVWQARATKITATISQEPKIPSSENQMQKCVEKMCAIKDELAQETANLQQRKHQIEEAIRSLEDKTEQDVLWYYYIRGMTFERIAVEMNYSWRQINRKHKSAMKKIKMS